MFSLPTFLKKILIGEVGEWLVRRLADAKLAYVLEKDIDR